MDNSVTVDEVTAIIHNETDMEDSDPSDGGLAVKNRNFGLTVEPIVMLICLGVQANREYLYVVFCSYELC